MEIALTIKIYIFFLLTAVLALNGVEETAPEPEEPIEVEPTNKPNQFFLGDRPDGPTEEQEPSFWMKKSEEQVKKLIRSPQLPIRAKNIILFVADGMSTSTVTAARIYKGQREGGIGESASLSFENFPYSGMSKTYCLNAQVADSACTATAFMSGVKTNYFALGVSGKTKFNNCSTAMDPDNHLDSLIKMAQAARKSTGIVTTTRVTHATPASAYAHVANRLYETDADMQMFGEDPLDCPDIATQLIENSQARKIDVVLGGGRTNFLPNTVIDEVSGLPGRRLDGVNLLEKWKQLNAAGVMPKNREELLNLIPNRNSKVLGLFSPQHMDYNLLADRAAQPSLEEMTESAIKVLSKNPYGYFLLVEGGRIDHAHHDTMAHLALDETVEFAKAIQKARDMTKCYDTLIVVTSDHSHTMTMSGYPKRNNDILNVNENEMASDNLPYLVLNYANGPEQYLDDSGKRIDIPQEMIKQNTFKYPAHIPRTSETHGGEDVAVYADGPYAHFFSGTYEQSDIPYKMAFASCIGKGVTHCRRYPIN